MKAVALQLIRAYQALSRGISTPLFLGSYSGCRSWPTCSDYAIESVERSGILRGGVRALIRFLRCNPLTPHTRT